MKRRIRRTHKPAQFGMISPAVSVNAKLYSSAKDAATIFGVLPKFKWEGLEVALVECKCSFCGNEISGNIKKCDWKTCCSCHPHKSKIIIEKKGFRPRKRVKDFHSKKVRKYESMNFETEREKIRGTISKVYGIPIYKQTTNL